MNKKKQKILLFFLFTFSVYCALIIGKSWDEGVDLLYGKSTLNYLFSIGKINDYFFTREYYSASYWAFQYLLTTIFPSKYEVEISHLINLFFSLMTIVGIGQIGKELFNKKVGKIVFLILFFYPVFFGHMGMNPKDTILAFSHVWVTLLILKYLRKQSLDGKYNNYFINIGVLIALATGIQLFFPGSLIPIAVFTLLEVFFFKKIINKNFNRRVFFIDLLKSFLVFYFILILFWIDAHPNILVLPYKIIMASLANDVMTGWPSNLVNGHYYLSWQIPTLYFLINIIYKSPEYFLILYLLFFILIFKSNNFFKKNFIHFNYKISFIIFVIIFPNIIAFFFPLPLYDGVRLLLWAVPYLCIIPGLVIYYLVENFKEIKIKIIFSFLSVLFAYFLFNFFMITPYHYTYLNSLNGEAKNRYQKFENDYWALSLNELIKKSSLDKKKSAKLAICGVPPRAYKYFKRNGYKNFLASKAKDADYIIMTNRTLVASGNLSKDSTNKTVKITNCFDKYKGQNISVLKRNGVILSLIRKKISTSNWD